MHKYVALCCTALLIVYLYDQVLKLKPDNDLSGLKYVAKT
jgi:hypothetical protein